MRRGVTLKSARWIPAVVVAGLCALGQVLSAADLERLDDATLSGLGCLLETIGGQLLETSHHGRDIAGVEPS